MPEKIAKIRKRLELAEAHVRSYMDHMSECETQDRAIWDEGLDMHRQEVSILKWTLAVLEEES